VTFDDLLAHHRALYVWGREERANLSPRMMSTSPDGDHETFARLTEGERRTYWLGYTERDRLSSLAARERRSGAVRGREGRRETAY
jgi:hypothetical protein